MIDIKHLPPSLHNIQRNPGNQEHVIADFSPDNLLDKKIQELERTKKNLEETKKRLEESVNKPIQRAQQSRVAEFRKDDEEISQGTPIQKRTQRKEEEAVGAVSNQVPFVKTLEDVIDNPNYTLMKANTVFPFDFFPDTLIIDPMKIKVYNRYFFFSQEIQTVYVKDILEASVEEAPFFATLQIITDHDKGKPIRISVLKKKDAEKAVKIIQGLVIARSESPDVAKVEAIR